MVRLLISRLHSEFDLTNKFRSDEITPAIRSQSVSRPLRPASASAFLSLCPTLRGTLFAGEATLIQESNVSEQYPFDPKTWNADMQQFRLYIMVLIVKGKDTNS